MTYSIKYYKFAFPRIAQVEGAYTVHPFGPQALVTTRTSFDEKSYLEKMTNQDTDNFAFRRWRWLHLNSIPEF